MTMRMPIKLTFVSVVLSITLLTLQGIGVACSCSRLPTPKAYEATSDVFIAQVIEILRPPSKMITNSDGSVSVSGGLGPDTVRLAVEESLKGVQGPQVSLDLGGDTCSYPFSVGEKYLVYASWENGKLSTDKCRRTRPLSSATADLTYIKGAAANEAQATLYGDVFRLIVDAEGKPALQTPFEELTVILAGGDTRVEAKAEKWGEYEVTVPPGDYEVWVERGGKRVTKKSEAITLKVGECRQKILPVEFR